MIAQVDTAFWDDLARLLLLRDANTRTVLMGTGILGLAAGVVGSFAVLRRRALVGDAVAHAALPGLCLAYFAVGGRSFPALLLGALLAGLAATGVISFIRAYTRIKEDAAIGIVIGSFFGLGIVLSRIAQQRGGGDPAGLDTFILGKAASMVRQDMLTIAIVAAVLLFIVALLYKEFKLLCFDREFARAEGFPALGLDLLLMAMICICTIAGLPAVGIVLMVAMLVIPGVTARFWTDRLAPMLVIAGALGAVSGVLGTALSAVLPPPGNGLSRGWPTGPLIVLVAASMFLFSAAAAPGRGWAAEWLRRRRQRARIGRHHLLRAAFEITETRGDPGAVWTTEDLLALRGWHESEIDRLIQRAWRDGQVISLGDGYTLTAAGRAEALQVVRAHRLWELYLIEHADISPDHVDRDADEIEHFLPREVLERFEERLRDLGRWPAPESPHRIGGAR